MAVRLAAATEPHWIELPGGARLWVRPCSTAIYEGAVSYARDQARLLLEGEGAGVNLADLTSKHARDGYSQMIFAEALAVNAIISWEGIVDDDDEPAAVTPETVTHLMRIHKCAEEFVTKYTADQALLVTEGNASRLSPNGTSGEGRLTVQGAATSERPAPPVQ